MNSEITTLKNDFLNTLSSSLAFENTKMQINKQECILNLNAADLKKENACEFNFCSKSNNNFDEETNNESDKKITNSSSNSENQNDSESSNFDLDDEEMSQDNKRVSAISKVNFKKLNDTEKEERLKNLAKSVKKLRRKVKSLESKFKSNGNKIVNKFISENINLKKKNTYVPNFDLDKLCRALKVIKDSEKHEYDDQRNLIENLIELIADERITPDSVNYKKLCTQIRLFLGKEKVKYIAKRGQKITFSFPEKDINISSKEYELYSKYKDKEDVIRTIVGLKEDEVYEEYPSLINFEPKKQKSLKEELILSNQQKNENAFGNINDKLNKGFNLTNTNKIKDLLSLGLCPSGNSVQNLLLNSIYSNIMQNIRGQNNFS